MSAIQRTDQLIKDEKELRQRLTVNFNLDVRKLSFKKLTYLYFALTDIIFVVQDGGFYLATMSSAKIRELLLENRIALDAGTNRALNFDTGIIQKYVNEGRFHLIKLTPLREIRFTNFICKVSTMNPYPTLDDAEVYSLTEVNRFFGGLQGMLTVTSQVLKMRDGTEEICQNFISSKRTICTSGEIIVHGAENEEKVLNLFDIDEVKSYPNNDFIKSLLSGVVRYDGKLVTLSYELLERYYGADVVYSRLESENVRKRLALSDILTSLVKQDAKYYINKYGLNIRDAETTFALELLLRESIKQDKIGGKVIHARQLCPYAQIQSGHKSYYVSINLDRLGSHDISEVDNTNEIMPKEYVFLGISSSLGYQKVVLNALSQDIALDRGKESFEHQFGDLYKFCSLYENGKLVKGCKRLSLGLNITRDLCQSMMYGYKSNYSSYSKKLHEICQQNGVLFMDDSCQYLFVNTVAKQYKDSADIKYPELVSMLVQYLCLLKDDKKHKQTLQDTLVRIQTPKVTAEYKQILADGIDSYTKVEKSDGGHIYTDIANYKITKNGLSNLVEFLWKKQSLGSHRLKV